MLEEGFEGSRERAGRSLTTAAILGFIIVAIIYFYAQTVIGFLAVVIRGKAAAGTSNPHETLTQLLTARALFTKPIILYSVIFSQFIFLLLPTIWLIRRWHTKHVLTYVRFRKTAPGQILLALVGGILFYPVSAGIGDFLMEALHFPDFLAKIGSLVFTSNTPSQLLLVILGVCVTPAICEETLFRGYIQRTLERTMGPKSIIVAGILFGLYHMRPLDLVSLSLFGMLIGFFVYRSKSILPSMTAHFTYNFVAVLSLYKSTNGSPTNPLASLHIPLTIILLSAAGTVVVILLYRNVTKGTDGLHIGTTELSV
jgi:membrane protease YdiL (CAAX protease family)